MPTSAAPVLSLFWMYTCGRSLAARTGRATAMRIKMDTAMIRFMITKPGEPKIDRDTREQKIDKTSGALLWQIQVMALDDTGGEILTVTVDSEPKFSVGEYVQLHDLVAIPWTQGDRSGVAFRAAGMTSLSAASKHAA
jgi:hypothetical protein